jgi:hypothetical protein
MYKVSQEVKNLFNKNYIQIVDITVNGVKESFHVTESEIVQGSLSIDRYSVSNSKIEVGSAIAAELTFKLKNDNGKYDDTVFEGAEVFIKIGIKKWDAHRWEKAVINWIPCGYFTIDEPPRTLSTITISALDRMILFDKIADVSKLSFPMTVADLLNKICTICGVTLVTDTTRLPNKDYQIATFPDNQTVTYRTLLQWCAALTGTCAFMNCDGDLELKWYEQTDLTISPSERYSSDMQENDITLTGVYFKDAGNTEYLAGTDDYCLDLSSNGLLQDNVQVVLDTLYVSLRGFSYRPYTATIKSAPYIYPMDMIHYEDAKGVVHDTIVTNVTFGMNLCTSIAGKGETTQKQKYSQSGGLTQQQATILEKLRENLNKVISAKEQAQLELNRLLSSSLGLNLITISQDDGTTVYYFCNGETLESSNIIYTFKANGFAWTNAWDDGHPTWRYGFSKDGNAIYNMLAAYKISAEYLEVGSITADKIATSYTTELKQYADSSSATALSDAKKDATTKANNALNAAKSDATAKADNALSAAKADATSKANAAESNAKADTAEKLKSYSTTEQMNTAIKQTADSITLEVGKTYVTTTTYETGIKDTKAYADSSSATALSDAKKDATTKANNALNAAKSDATAKADNALSAAKADATSKANAAESNAKADTAEKLKSYSDTTNATIDDKFGQAKDYTDSVKQTVTTEYGTKLDETAMNFNLSVNSLSERVTEQGNEVNAYKETLETYFDFSQNGLLIGKKSNGQNQQYSINIDNEKMAFLQDGSEVAYVQYNKLHINAIEAMDRLSVGAAADGGYFDFISTQYGMGVKWRAVEKVTASALAMLARSPVKRIEYSAIEDENDIFTMEVSEDECNE